jgi:hypothetical protein
LFLLLTITIINKDKLRKHLVVELEPIHYFYFSLKHVLRTMTTTFEFEFYGFCPYMGAVINWTWTYREENFVHSCEHACREKF